MSREQFEIWFLKECEPDFELRLKDGEYTDETAQYMWEGWQAATESQGVEPWEPSGVDYDRAIHHNPDTKAWADLFVQTFPGQADQHDLMIGWFANAMMAMYDHVKNKEAHPKPTGGGVPEGLTEKALELCRAVENEEEFPPAKFALRCLMLVNQVRRLAATQQPPEPTTQLNTGDLRKIFEQEEGIPGGVIWNEERGFYAFESHPNLSCQFNDQWVTFQVAYELGLGSRPPAPTVPDGWRNTILSALSNMQYAAFNLCPGTTNDDISRKGRYVTESTCPEKSLLIAIRDLSALLNTQNHLVDANKKASTDHVPDAGKMISGQLKVMGNIDLLEDGEAQPIDMALVITFDNSEDIRQAIADGQCKFSFGE